MFRALGQFVARTWPVLLVAWIAVFGYVWWIAPPWRDVAPDLEFAFLPESAPSRIGEAMFRKAFPFEDFGSNIVLLLERAPGQKGKPTAELKFIENVMEPALRQIAQDEGGLARDADPDSNVKPSVIAQIRTPNGLGTGALLISPDESALIVVMDLTTEFHSHDNWPTITKIEEAVEQFEKNSEFPAGAHVYLTGSALVGRDHTLAELDSARATGLWTMILVIILLILIYRAPVLALISLITVYMAAELSLHLLAIFAGQHYLSVFAGLEVFIAILTYGAGVDYYLLLTARYKEELDAGATFHEAVTRALGKTGAAITASAGTVTCGIGMMYFAQFGKFHDAGLTIPLALLIVLVATFTFSAPLLLLTGRWAFWPGKMVSGKAHAHVPSELERYWSMIAELMVRRSGLAWAASVLVLLPFAIGAGVLYSFVNFDLVGDLPATAKCVVGSRKFEEHFPAGLMGPTSVLIVDQAADFRRSEDRQWVDELIQHLVDQKQSLGLIDVRGLTAPLGFSEQAKHAFDDSNLPKDAIARATEESGLEHYASDFGERAKTGTRLELILQDNPFSARSIDKLAGLEAAVRNSLPQELRDRSDLYFQGTTVSLADLRTVVSGDRVRIEVLVLVVVFGILIILLRNVSVSLYLILSVLLSYYATLGVTFLFFWALDPQHFAGLDWKVTIFLFTILIAVGEDYNIFLMARIEEEQETHGPVRGIVEALVRTGSVISSAGIIMAGTFASLLAGSLTEMKQLGFALTFGVLLDTFLVRPVLVPSFLLMINQQREKDKKTGN
jgi:RND superfamily putative drug exporter